MRFSQRRSDACFRTLWDFCAVTERYDFASVIFSSPLGTGFHLSAVRSPAIAPTAQFIDKKKEEEEGRKWKLFISFLRTMKKKKWKFRASGKQPHFLTIDDLRYRKRGKIFFTSAFWLKRKHVLLFFWEKNFSSIRRRSSLSHIHQALATNVDGTGDTLHSVSKTFLPIQRYAGASPCIR